MSSPNVINKNFGNFRGLDLRSSDLQRPEGFCSAMMNAIHNKSGVLSKRKGYKQRSASLGGNGSAVYANLNLSTNAITEQIVTVGSTLYKLAAGSLNVTYTGSANVYLSIYFYEDEYLCTINSETTELLNLPLGLGRNEASPVTIATLSAAIDALTDFTSTVTGTSSSPAAFLDTLDYQLLTPSVATTIPFYTFSAVNSPTATMFSQSNVNDTDFINASIINAQNNLYIGTGYDELMKYDGQNLYRAGMPEGATPNTAATVNVTTINNSALSYIVTYIQKDAKGNIVEGIASVPSNALNITNTGISVVIPNILAASKFNTNCGIVNGAQVGVTTITVDSGHTLKVGDTAYFLNSSTYVEREITAIAATTITITGTAVTVADNTVISNNLKIALYRNVAAGTTYSLVVELPNNSFASTQGYTDLIEDVNLGAEYIFPIKPHGLPPRGRFLNLFRNQLFIADNLNTVYYSDIDNVEYFPSGDNSFDVYTNRGDAITGLGSLPNLLVTFKGKSIHAASGDFSQDTFRVDQVNKGEIGCIAHHTIQEVNGSLFFLSEKGVFSITDSAELKELSFNIEPEFTQPNTSYNLRKATALNWLFQDLYLVLLPVEETVSSNKYLDQSNSKLFAYDYAKESWFEWSNINSLGGFFIYNNVAWFVERRYSTELSAASKGLFTFNNTGSYLDYLDHDEAISFSYSTGWESGEQPSLFKKFLRLKMYSLEGDFKDGEVIPFDLDIAYQFNYIPNDTATSTLDFAGGGLGYGDDAWSDDSFGSSSVPEVIARMPATKSRAVRMIFTNDSLLENVLISGYEIEISVPYKTFIKE